MTKIAGGIIGGIGAKKAGSTQAKGYDAAGSAMSPYNDLGIAMTGDYKLALNNPILTTPFQFNAQNLESTPGYKFTLDQGLKAATNSAASRGLGYSGSQLRGASQYASGLAQNTYNDEYNRQLNAFNANQQQGFNRLQSIANMVGLGANAAQQQGNFMTGASTARAGGQAGMYSNIATGLVGQSMSMNPGGGGMGQQGGGMGSFFSMF